jgi:cytochrome bd-type quinol oxidase subunit 2
VAFTIKSREDFLAGLMFIGFGVAAVIIARDYPMGTAMRMGPGYFPTYIGVLLILMGAVISTIATFGRERTESARGFAWRPVIMLSLAFALYGIAMEPLGFIPSLVILIFTTSLAGKEFRITEVVILMVVLIVAALAVFIYGINLPFRLFWWS